MIAATRAPAGTRPNGRANAYTPATSSQQLRVAEEALADHSETPNTLNAAASAQRLPGP